jgi:transcriptional regulator with XRE-family HTH domain
VTKDTQKALGAAIRVRRSAIRGLSQERLGEIAGLNRTYVGGIERGLRNPTYRNLVRLAVALDVPLSELVAQAERLERGERPVLAE